MCSGLIFFFFQAEDGIRDIGVTGVQTCALPISMHVRSKGVDAVIMIESCFGLGFMLGTSFGTANPPNAVGHAGAGGSLAFADPDRSLAFAYVMNDLRFDPTGDPRSHELVQALYRCV